MALKKEMALGNGVTGDYWIATNLRIDNIKKVVTGVDLVLFLDEKTRKGGADALHRELRQVELDYVEKSFEEVMIEVYETIKESEKLEEKDPETNFFADAVDC